MCYNIITVKKTTTAERQEELIMTHIEKVEMDIVNFENKLADIEYDMETAWKNYINTSNLYREFYNEPVAKSLNETAMQYLEEYLAKKEEYEKTEFNLDNAERTLELMHEIA
jgi:hypothetical protein